MIFRFLLITLLILLLIAFAVGNVLAIIGLFFIGIFGATRYPIGETVLPSSRTDDIIPPVPRQV